MNNEDFKVVLSDKEYIEKLEKEVHYQNKEVTRLNNIINEYEDKGYDIAQERADFLLEIQRLNNIINSIDSFVDRTIEIIKQQPSGNDEWILERLNGIKYLKELKENNNGKNN